MDINLNLPTLPTTNQKNAMNGANAPSTSNVFATINDLPSVSGYVPYTGANQNVNLGEYEIKVGQLTLDITPTGTAAVGTTRWNDSLGSSETTLKGGTVILKNGVDLLARVVNKVTPNSTLTRATYHAVRISGAQGQRLAVAYAQANNDNNSADTIGLVCEDIATNQEGFIITMGQLLEINTTGSLQSETWADGDVLYLSPTTPGHITNIKPTGATGHIVVMGYVEYSHAVHGKIYVKIMNGWELNELHNVYINGVADKDLLSYESSTSLWKNKSASTLGISPLGFTLQGSWASTSPADNTTYYSSLAPGTIALTTSRTSLTPIVIPKNCTLKSVSVNIIQGAASSETVTYNIDVNSVSTLIGTTNSTATIITVSNYAMGVTCLQGELIYLQIVTPSWVTNPVNMRGIFTCYFE